MIFKTFVHQIGCGPTPKRWTDSLSLLDTSLLHCKLFVFQFGHIFVSIRMWSCCSFNSSEAIDKKKSSIEYFRSIIYKRRASPSRGSSSEIFSEFTRFCFCSSRVNELFITTLTNSGLRHFKQQFQKLEWLIENQFVHLTSINGNWRAMSSRKTLFKPSSRSMEHNAHKFTSTSAKHHQRDFLSTAFCTSV